MKPIVKAISYIIYSKDKTKFLAVKRPSDDKYLPDTWGLPAGIVKRDESDEDSVLRSGMQKLGIKLKIIKQLNEGKQERDNHFLHMKLYEAEITEGEPKVPQQAERVTQYQEWKWAEADELKEAVKKGSLCSGLYLESLNKE